MNDKGNKHDSGLDEEGKDDLSIKEDDQDQNTKEKDELHDPVNDSLTRGCSCQECHQIHALMETECAAKEGGGKF